jgi:signal transduction histidine kinase
LAAFIFSSEKDIPITNIVKSSDEETKLNYLVEIYKSLGQNPDSAYYLLQDFYPKIKNNEKDLQLRFRTILATYYWNRGKLDTAAYIFQQNIDTATKYNLRDRKINAIANFGAILNVMGEHDSAYYYLKKSLPLAIEDQDSGMVAKIQFDIGNYYKRKGYLQLALEELHKSLVYYEQNPESIIIVYLYNSLANVYKELGYFDKSVQYYYDAIQLDSLRDDVFLLHDLYNNLGVTHWKLGGSADSARYYINKALDISLQFNSPMHQYIYLSNLGGLEADEGNYKKALELLLEAKDIQEQYPDLYKKSALYVNLGTTYRYLNDYKKAQEYYNEALLDAQKISAFDNLMNVYGGLMQLDSVQGNLLSSIEHQRLAYNFKDSLNNEEVQKKVAELEIIHQTEQKEKENQLLQNQNRLQSDVIRKQSIITYTVTSGLILVLLLVFGLYSNSRKLQRAKIETEQKNKEILEKNELIRKKNRDLELQKEELVLLNQTKDKFFTIVAHDLKNPFSGLLGLLDILETDFHDLEDDKKLEIISKLNQNGRNTYNMLVNLLDWARTQKGTIVPVLESVSLKKLIKSSMLFLGQRIQDKEHRVFLGLEDDILLQTDPNLLRTAIINILNNAVKFSNRRGEIIIGVIKNDNSVIISIKDNGIGMDREKLSQVFSIATNLSSKGTENELGTGLGLILCKEFVQLLNGSIRAESEVGKGSVFYIELPLA